MSCSIQLHNEYPIVYYQHNGAIGKESILYSWQKVLVLLLNQSFCYNLILDFRGAFFVFQTFEIDDIVYFFNSSINLLHNRKIGGIINRSHEAAIIKMLETLRCNEADYQVKLFGEMETAFDYLGKDR